MSPNGWQRRVLHAEGPTATAGERTIEQCAISAADVGLYALALVRHDLGQPRVVAKLSAAGRGIGPWQTHCLDLQTGEGFTVCSTDGAWEARRLNVTDLPPALLAAWPRDHNGRPMLRRLAGSVDSTPAQGSLFG